MSESTETVVRGRAPVGPDGALAPVAVHVLDGRIVDVSAPAGPVPSAIVAPGFVDLQVNGVDDVDCASAAGDDWSRLGERLARTGVTAWLPTLVSRPLDRYAEPLAVIEDARHRDDGPTVLGAHLEGPFLGGRPGAHRRDAIVPIDAGWLGELPPTVRLVTLAPEQPHVVDAIERLVGRGIVASLGHSDADHATSVAAIDAGATMVTHLFNAMAPVHQREPGMVGAALADDRVVAGLIADLVHVHPALLATAFRAKGRGRVALVTDSVAWRSVPPAVGLSVVDGAPRLPDGTLAGSALTMDQAIRNVVDVAGVELGHALAAASTTPAAVLGERDRGRIAIGGRADLVVLDADDLSVRRTIVAGRTIWESDGATAHHR